MRCSRGESMARGEGKVLALACAKTSAINIDLFRACRATLAIAGPTIKSCNLHQCAHDVQGIPDR